MSRSSELGDLGALLPTQIIEIGAAVLFDGFIGAEDFYFVHSCPLLYAIK